MRRVIWIPGDGKKQGRAEGDEQTDIFTRHGPETERREDGQTNERDPN